MSLAIGTWLFDASADYSKNSKQLNASMLAAMSIKTTTYNDTPDTVVNNSYKDAEKKNVDKTSQNRVNSNKKLSKIESDYMWVIK